LVVPDSAIEPFSNISNVMNDSKVMDEPEEDEWIQENLIAVPIDVHSKIVDFFFINSRMLCVFEDFNVQEIDLVTKQVASFYNL